jgi:glycosyltransferase involved in cell wall biosynthesis
MACGCPVLASDIAPVREFANEAAYYFDPLDIEAIADGMRAFQNNQAGREKKRIRGLQRAEAFRPRPVVKRLMEAYAIIE